MDEQIILNYQYWTGFNKFYCRGKIMTGPDGLKYIIFTSLGINVPIVFILIFDILVNLI